MPSMPKHLLEADSLRLLCKAHWPFPKEADFPVPSAVTVPEVKYVSAESLPKPLPFRKFLGGALKEPGISFAWISDGRFNVLGVMEDSDPYNLAATRRDKTWLSGDVLELFLQPSGGELYYEFHIAPNGVVLELLYPSAAEFHAKTSKFENAHVEKGLEAAAAEFSYEGRRCWAGLMSVPADLLPRLEGSHFAVCRYNRNRPDSDNAELSSTCVYDPALPSYHSPGSWHRIS